MAVANKHIGTDAASAAVAGNTSASAFEGRIVINGLGVINFGSGLSGSKGQGNRTGTDPGYTRNRIRFDNGGSNNLFGDPDAGAAQEGDLLSGNQGVGYETGFHGVAAGGNQLDGVSVAATNNTVGATTGGALEGNVLSGTATPTAPSTSPTAMPAV